MLKSVRDSVFIVFSPALLYCLGLAQAQDPSFTLNVDVGLVQLPVSVLDRQLRLVPGLKKDDFRIFEDGVAQTITVFNREDVPLSVGLVIDNSGSMNNKRSRVNAAALAFIRANNPEDETFIVNFDQETYIEQDFTNNINDLIHALSGLNTRGETALYDAVYLSADHLQNGKRDKKALVVISDGEDTASRYTLPKVVEALRKSNVTLYAIGLLEERDGRRRRRSPAQTAREALQEFASVTGGQAYFPKSLDEVEEICKRIAHDLRNQYSIGYFSSNKNLDGAWRKVTVTLNTKNSSQTTVRTKPGYYAPRVDSEIKQR
jgi:Ca-activated chloride channel homolog